MVKQMAVKNWTITPWMMNGQGGWKQQPIILVEGQQPFFADHPDAYIAKLLELHDDPTVARAPFHTYIGQFRDGLEQAWNAEVLNASSNHRNGQRI